MRKRSTILRRKKVGFSSMSKILVTGAAGFIASHLLPVLRDRSMEVVAVGRDAGDVANVTTWSAFPTSDTVVHLAGKTFVPESWQNPTAYLQGNFLGTIHALEFCRKHRSRLIFLSSYLYGNSSTQPIAESAPVVATNPYALSKKLSEEACAFYSKHFGVNVTILRPFNVYGPGQPNHFLIPSIARAIAEGTSIKVQDVEPRRDYVYIDDLVRAVVLAIDKPMQFGVLNVGSGKSYSVAEIIAKLQALKQTDLPIENSGIRRPDEIMDCRADISAAYRTIGWVPNVSIDEGLGRILDSRLP